jgi:hypothetical protein
MPGKGPGHGDGTLPFTEAQEIILYTDGAGASYGYSQEAGLVLVLADYMGSTGPGEATSTLPYNVAQASLAALQAAMPDGAPALTMLPAGISPRKLAVDVGGCDGGLAWKQLGLVVGDPADYRAYVPTGAAPYPVTPVLCNPFAYRIAGASGESRSSN